MVEFHVQWIANDPKENGRCPTELQYKDMHGVTEEYHEEPQA
jgi:hypothetical protein